MKITFSGVSKKDQQSFLQAYHKRFHCWNIKKATMATDGWNGYYLSKFVNGWEEVMFPPNQRKSKNWCEQQLQILEAAE